MNRFFIYCLIATLLPLSVFAQNSKKKKGNSIFAATNFNYYPLLKPYSFTKEFYLQDDELLLKFITPNSGTFVIKENDLILVKSYFESRMPSQLMGIGTSIQFRNLENVFHEISITRLSLSRSDRLLTYTGTDSDSTKFTWSAGHRDKMFAIGMRYELGKYFGRSKDAVVRFGLSGGIEPSFFLYKSTPYAYFDYPLDAKLLTIDIALIPMVSVKASKSVSLDFKCIPNFLTADFGTMRREDPTLPKIQHGGTRIYTSPDMTWAFSMQLRYMIKEAKKKRRKE